ncbi:unnamed protein product [Linum trigynum]|uniref:Uncharacterized protein n=1 Tax=Linum trigynum TaxID=586398 RepID=A0AAV2CD99_9ROSI
MKLRLLHSKSGLDLYGYCANFDLRFVLRFLWILCKLPPRISKKKKLKINIHRPVGTRVVFDDQGNTLPPLCMVAGANNDDGLSLFEKDKRDGYYKNIREQLMKADKVDKVLDHQRRRDKGIKEKMKWKRVGDEEEGSDKDIFGSGGDEGTNGRKPKRWKIYFNSDSDDDGETRGKKEM